MAAKTTKDEPQAKPAETATARSLKYGDEGPEVAALQAALFAWGVLGGSNLGGKFDICTENALKHFQGGQNLPETGIADETTFAALGY